MPLQSRSGQSSCLSNWYHGTLSREETERKMKTTPGLPNGSFLVRYSHSTRKYVLSVLHDHIVYHYPIEELTDGFYQVHGTNAKYLGIDLLVAEFRRTNSCIVCSLSRPVSGGIRPPSHFVVYGMTNELHLAVRKGNLKGAKEVLLREQQQQQHQQFVASESGGVNGKESPSLFLIVNAKSADNGATPIIEAAKTGSSDLVKLLLDWDSEVNLRDCGGCTALHRACQKSFAHVAETLLKQGGANPQIKCPFSGNTPLHEAAMLGHTDCVNTLLRFHAAAWARNLDGEMPFELAHRFGFRELGEALAAYRPPQPLTTQVDWFHPDLSKQETDNFLLSIAAARGNGVPDDGVFLVRRSSRNGDKKYVLAVTCKGSCLKYKIEWVTEFPAGGHDQGAYFIDKGPLYPSLDHLVEHYCRFVDGIPVRLRTAINAAARDPTSSPEEGIICVDKLVPPGVEQRDREPLKIRSASGASVCVPGEGPAAFVERNTSGYRNEHFPRVMQRPGSSAVAPAHPKRRSAGDSSSGSTGSSSAASLPSNEQLPGPAGILAGVASSGQLRLIPCESVILLYRLGEGEFGAVFHGQLINTQGNNSQQPQQTMDVAVKVLVQPSARLDFLKEASVMMQLSHSNILGMYGICENKRLMMLLELAPLGALLDYLQENAEMVQLPLLYRWAEQIADGMAYLESRGFVHRDLACRNVLLYSETEAKISDFGLSRAVGVDTDYYKATRRGKWPVKWYAPESIYYKTFSHSSDVWSYGVCLWEMFSLGEHPYDHWDGFEVLKQVEEGYRLPHPKLATHRVYQLMKNCWSYKPEDRPSFAELLRAFRHLVVNVYENVQPPDLSRD